MFINLEFEKYPQIERKLNTVFHKINDDKEKIGLQRLKISVKKHKYDNTETKEKILNKRKNKNTYRGH